MECYQGVLTCVLWAGMLGAHPSEAGPPQWPWHLLPLLAIPARPREAPLSSGLRCCCAVERGQESLTIACLAATEAEGGPWARPPGSASSWQPPMVEKPVLHLRWAVPFPTKPWPQLEPASLCSLQASRLASGNTPQATKSLFLSHTQRPLPAALAAAALGTRVVADHSLRQASPRSWPCCGEKASERASPILGAWPVGKESGG